MKGIFDARVFCALFGVPRPSAASHVFKDQFWADEKAVRWAIRFLGEVKVEDLTHLQKAAVLECAEVYW